MKSVLQASLKKIILANVGLALFGTPIVYLFISTLKEATLTQAVGGAFVFVSIFLTMTIGLDLFMSNTLKVEE